jgi:hypothetical protein
MMWIEPRGVAVILASLAVIAPAACGKPTIAVIAADDAPVATASTNATAPSASSANGADPGACVWTLVPPVDGVAEICRDTETRATCVPDDAHPSATFTKGSDCRSIGFPCLGTTWSASSRRLTPDGGCPAGSELL